MSTTSIHPLDFLAGLLQQSGEAVQRPEAAPADAGELFSDELLVERIVRHGHHPHFGMLLARYRSRVFHIALSVLGPGRQSEAEDVAQEIFVRLYQRLDSFRGECKFSTWLHRLSINAAIDYRRRSERHRAGPIDEAHPPAVLVSDSGPDLDPRTAQRIREAIDQLPHSQRMMVHLFYWLELKISEIAEVLECPEGTVKVYLQRARTSLADSLEELRHD